MNFEKTTDSSIGASVYSGVGIGQNDFAGNLLTNSVNGNLGLGYTFTQQNSNSSTIFSFIDMDRDGLVDIVEKGENYYLRNKGNYEFEKCDIHISNISDFKETLSQPQIESYEKSYFVQTPFRMWKSPYEGIISITETSKGIQGSYKPETSVKTLTYINESKEPESELNIVVDSTNPKTAKKENIDIKKDDHIYFISDNGTEPANFDIEWNVKIDYSKVKALKNNFPAPYIYYSKITNNIKNNKLNGSTEEAAKKSFIDNNFKGDNDVILKLFNFNKQSADNSGNAVIVSACLAGDNCKYNGGNNLNLKMMAFLQYHEIVKVCPEVLSGLPTPRPSAEIVEGQVMNTEGKNITKEFTLGAQKAFEIVKKENPDLIILQSRSPSCGIKQIYDGTFSGKKIPGHGLFATLCIEAGYKVLDIEDIDKYLSKESAN